MLQIPELLAPAGDLERLRYAINYGADAVYCGLPEFGMRSAPANFTPEQLAEGVIYAHARGRKVYLTMNTLPTNEEADRLPEAIKEAAKAGVDAFIVADLGVLDACKTFAPDIDVHMSTQTGITNWAAARAAYNMGAKRVVLARELSMPEVEHITKHCGIETECLRARRAVHVLQRPVRDVCRHRAAQRQPRCVRPALPSALRLFRQGGRPSAEPEGREPRALRAGDDGHGRRVPQDRGAHEAPGVRRRRDGDLRASPA